MKRNCMTFEDSDAARIKKEISPAVPCVRADADGRCSTGNCQGSICCQCADYKPVTAVSTSADLPALVLEHPVCATTAEAVRFDLDMAKKHGAMTLAYLARAGWRLACEKQGAGYGAWENWIEKNVGISKKTADRYIAFYYGTVGEHLRAQGTAHRLVDELTDKMIEEATAGLESKTATGAMIELGIVKRPPGWGGEREGAGRKGALPKLSPTQEAETLWAQAMVVFDKPSLKDAIRYLGEKAATVCLDRVADLAEALKLQVRELRGVR